MSAYDERRLALAVDFINTFGADYDEPEQLRTVEDATRFLRQHGMVDVAVDDVALGEIRALRDRLRAAVVAQDPDAIAVVVNDLLDTARVVPRLARDRSGVWSIDLESAPAAAASERVSAEVALGVALALVRYGPRQLRVCASEPCHEVFLDTSRNRSRRFCSDRCANRHNVAAFRERQRGARGSG